MLKASKANLKCSNCSLYLSYFPIHTHPDGQISVCSRCIKMKKRNWFHNVIYEMAIENFHFPCSWKGCTGMILPADIPNHEKWCRFRKMRCPIAKEQCSWRGRAVNGFQHCKDEHEDYVLKNSVFVLNIDDNAELRYMYAFGPDYFVISRKIHADDTFICSVRYVGYDPAVKNFTYKLTLKTHEENVIIISGNVGEAVSIPTATILRSFRDPSAVVAEIDINDACDAGETKNDVQGRLCNGNGHCEGYESIEHLKCEVCHLYMLPPIYLCKTGHSTCLNCKENAAECSTCQTQVSAVRNFALESSIAYVKYPCKYKECNFVCNSMDIRMHQSECPYRPIVCPIEKCLDTPNYFDINKHLTGTHKELVHVKELFTVCLEQSEKHRSFIIPYKNKVFIFDCKHNYDLSITLEVRLVGTVEDSNPYKFEFDLHDACDSWGIFIKEKCGSYSDVQADVHLVRLYYDQIKPYVKNNELRFKIRIVEENV